MSNLEGMRLNTRGRWSRRLGYPRWMQRGAAAWFVLLGRESLQAAWQRGYQDGSAKEFHRIVVNGGDLLPIYAEECERYAAIAENPGFIEARDSEWDEGVNYAKQFIAKAIRDAKYGPRKRYDHLMGKPSDEDEA